MAGDNTARQPAPPGFVRGEAEANGVRLCFLRGGDPAGPPALLWHGFLGTSHVWRHVTPLLAGRGYAVLVPDMRGYGDSGKPAGPDGYDGLNLAEDFRALVRATGFGGGRPLLLAAHDMGAPPALLWAAKYPTEVAALAYLEEPVLLPEVLREAFAFTPEGTRLGGLWWWTLALAPDAAERLVADGREREFLTWFYDHYTADRAAVPPTAVDEYLRTFAGREGVAGAFGVYRALFRTVEQTAPLARGKARVPVLGLGGEMSEGERVRDMLALVAERVEGGAVAGCGHFIPEERPEELAERLHAFAGAAGMR